MTTWVKPPFVSEREDGHYWPNKQYDDPADEDCVFVSGLMCKLAHDPGSAPATLFEAERIREDAGMGPAGPASSYDLIRGETKRYGWAPTVTLKGFAALWAVLTPGVCAGASGNPHDAPGTPFQRFLSSDVGHRVFVGRYDTTDRVWLMDPEGPKDGSYQGQWVTKADLQRFVQNGNSHTYTTMAEETELLSITDTTPKIVTTRAGAQYYDPATGATVSKAVETNTRPSPYAVGIYRVVAIDRASGITQLVGVKSGDPAVTIAAVPTPPTPTKLAAGLYQV